MTMKYLLLAAALLLSSVAQAAAPVISLSASRTTGTAPLYVNFDATGTTDADTSNPFHDLDYEWSFGDTNAGLWGNGADTSLSKNFAKGPVAAHVFETAGTYTVFLKVSDGTTPVRNTSTTITVTAADITFSATTACISTGIDFTGCPLIPGTYADSATCIIAGPCVTSSDVDATCTTQLAAGKRRLLWRRGDTGFLFSTFCFIGVTGPGILGSFGSGAKPIFTGTGSPQNAIEISNSTTYSGLTDWRIMDLKFVGPSNYAYVVNGGGTTSNILMLRLDMTGFGIGAMFNAALLDNYNINSGGSHVAWDKIAVVDCTWVLPFNSNSYPVFMSAERAAIMGNNFNNNNTGAHLSRFGYAAKMVISNNTLSSPKGSEGNEVIKLHAPTWRTFTGTTHSTTTIDGIWNTTGYVTNEIITGSGIPANTRIATIASASSITITSAATASATVTLTLANKIGSAGIGGGYSRWVVISGNKFVGDTAIFTVSMQAQNSSSDERVKDVIVEKNWFTSGPIDQYGLIITAQEITVRNNLIDMTGGTDASRCILVYQPGNTATQNTLIPQNIWIYNNTCYTSDTWAFSSKVAFVWLGTSASTIFPDLVTISNNLMYAPNALVPQVIVDSGATNRTTGINTSDAQAKNTSPSFDSVTPTTPQTFRIGTGSYAATGGTAIFPASNRDFFNCDDNTANERLGAFVPRTRARCTSAARQ